MRRKFTMTLVALASLGALCIFGQEADEVSPNSTAITGTASAGFVGTKEFASSGTFVVPSTVTTMLVEVYGGGGGGGAECGGAGGGGGGAGAFSRSVIKVSPGSSLSVRVGAGGAAGSGSSDNGTAGGTSLISVGTTTLVFANGGGGGLGGCHGGGGGGGGVRDPAAMISHAGQAGGHSLNGFGGTAGKGYPAIGFTTATCPSGLLCFTIGKGGSGGGPNQPSPAANGNAGYVLLTFRSPGFVGIKEFTTSGTGTFVVPSTVTTMLAEFYDGGGGGGAECGGTPGGGGGGGAFSRSVIKVSPGSILSVRVGAGGAAGSGSSDNGTAGGTSLISVGTTTLVFANGGVGGLGGCHGGGGGAGGARDPAAMISHAGQAGGHSLNGFGGLDGRGYPAIGFTSTPCCGAGLLSFTIGQGGSGGETGNAPLKGYAGYVLLTF